MNSPNVTRAPVRFALLAALALPALTTPASAQSSFDFRGEFLRQFQMSSGKMTMLSEAMPAETYDWSPGEEVFTVGRVYAHIARYNYYYLATSLGIPAPEGVDWENLESLTDKGEIRTALQASVEHVRSSVSAMSDEDLSRTVTLYGREVPGQAVLFQLLAHMNEHVGQAIAYARTNDIVPPWSR